MKGWIVVLGVAFKVLCLSPDLLFYMIPRRFRGGWRSPWERS